MKEKGKEQNDDVEAEGYKGRCRYKKKGGKERESKMHTLSI